MRSNSTTIGTSTLKNLSFSGGAVGTTAVNIGLNTASTTPAVQSTVVASAAYQAPTAATASTITAANDFTNIDLSNNADNTYTFDVTLGASTANISLGPSDGTAGVINIDQAVTAIQSQLDAQSVAVTVGKDVGGTKLTFTANTAGATALTVDNFAVGGTGVIASAGDAGVTVAGQTDTGAAAQDRVITISNGTNTANITLTSANAGDAATARSYITAQLTAQSVSGITVGGTGNNIDLAGLADGTNSVTVGGAGADAVFGAGRTVTAGTADSGDGAVKTVDQLVTAINSNASLTGKIKASNDGGKLNIQNLSTEDLTVTGISSTDSGVDGSTGTATVGGNTVRKNLISQFNDLRSQLDKIADDSSFNGVNLLRGDTLKLIFNETNTSSISIVSQNANGINSSVLSIGAADATEFSSNNALDSRSDALHTALTQLRSQASAFGSNLSIVQNRQDFTKNIINTLQTGSDSLTLADGNAEAANLLALQTRQQLSTTALSLASQADQAVLRLFG